MAGGTQHQAHVERGRVRQFGLCLLATSVVGKSLSMYIRNQEGSFLLEESVGAFLFSVVRRAEREDFSGGVWFCFPH